MCCSAFNEDKFFAFVPFSVRGIFCWRLFFREKVFFADALSLVRGYFFLFMSALIERCMRQYLAEYLQYTYPRTNLLLLMCPLFLEEICISCWKSNLFEEVYICCWCNSFMKGYIFLVEGYVYLRTYLFPLTSTIFWRNMNFVQEKVKYFKSIFTLLWGGIFLSFSFPHFINEVLSCALRSETISVCRFATTRRPIAGSFSKFSRTKPSEYSDWWHNSRFDRNKKPITAGWKTSGGPHIRIFQRAEVLKSVHSEYSG